MKRREHLPRPVGAKRAIGWEPFIFLAVFGLIFGLLGSRMGMVNLINTLMNTAFDLLTGTVFYIMAVAVVAGALSALLSEFGVIALINRLLSPLMKPLFGLPGAASLGIMATYLSDNPAVLALAADKNFRRFFRRYQLPALTNLGTSFGMGLVVTTFMAGLSGGGVVGFGKAALIGNLGAVIGSIVSTRLMIRSTRRFYGEAAEEPVEPMPEGAGDVAHNYRVVREGNVGMRCINAILDGGKTGVTLGFDIIPGVLIICSLVMILTNGPGEGGVYTGAAYEGIQLLPWLGDKLGFILKPLFGFSSPEGVAVPITALGSAGAAMGLVPSLLGTGLAGGQDVAVFTAMCMCWSGYLSTHVAMMSSLECSKLTGKAIMSHTIGGLVAGISAHWLYRLISLI